jgi:hypothetical protein
MKVFQISPEQIPEKPEAFHRALETLLGLGAKLSRSRLLRSCIVALV